MVVAPREPEVLWTVVGVVEDSRYRSFPEPRPAAYLPLARYHAIAPSRLFVRIASGTAATEGGIEARTAATTTGPLAELVASVLEAQAPEVRLVSVEAMEDVMREPTLRPRFAAAVLLSFALATVLLAGLGVYGVFSLLVQERANELGVRRALGASASDLARFVARRVLVIAVVGAAAGGTVSAYGGRLLESLLFGVEPSDPLTLAAVVTAAVVGGGAAAAVPALRAARVDPVVALRAE